MPNQYPPIANQFHPRFLHDLRRNCSKTIFYEGVRAETRHKCVSNIYLSYSTQYCLSMRDIIFPLNLIMYVPRYRKYIVRVSQLLGRLSNCHPFVGNYSHSFVSRLSWRIFQLSSRQKPIEFICYGQSYRA